MYRAARKSAVFAALQPPGDVACSLLRSVSFRKLLKRFSSAGDARHDKVEAEGQDLLQALDVFLPVADAGEPGGLSARFAEENRIPRGQDAMLAGVPQKYGRPVRVSGRGDDLVVVAEHVPLLENLVHVCDFSRRLSVVPVDVEQARRTGP